MRDLHRASREELLELVLQQQEQITALVTRVTALEEENRQLRKGGGKTAPAWVKPNRPVRGKQDRKRRAGALVRRNEAQH